MLFVGQVDLDGQHGLAKRDLGIQTEVRGRDGFKHFDFIEIIGDRKELVLFEDVNGTPGTIVALAASGEVVDYVGRRVTIEGQVGIDLADDGRGNGETCGVNDANGAEHVVVELRIAEVIEVTAEASVEVPLTVQVADADVMATEGTGNADEVCNPEVAADKQHDGHVNLQGKASPRVTWTLHREIADASQ